MIVRARYTVTAITATTVTLGPKSGGEDEDRGGDPGLFGGGTIVVTTTPATPSAQFWKLGTTGVSYIVCFERH